MSADPHYQATEEAHTGPIKNPKQLLLAVFFSFIAPILIIVGLVSYVVSGTKPAGTAEGDNMALYGVSKESRDRKWPTASRRSAPSRSATPTARSPPARPSSRPSACLPRRARHSRRSSPERRRSLGPRIGQGYATLLNMR
jgi:hypothetical protein